MSAVKSISDRLNSSIKSLGIASLVLSGGSSPIKIFDELSNIDLPWSKVQVTLVDDRLVEANNRDSNQNLILNYFLKNNAKAAQFFPLTEDLITKSNFFKMPFDVSLLGMGEDGHIASIFPNSKNLFEKFVTKPVIRKDFKCSFPFKQLVINNEKQVLPCCTFWGEELALQKISKPEDLKEAWNSEKMRNLRQKHLDGNYSDIPQCKNCVQGGLD